MVSSFLKARSNPSGVREHRVDVLGINAVGDQRPFEIDLNGFFHRPRLPGIFGSIEEIEDRGRRILGILRRVIAEDRAVDDVRNGAVKKIAADEFRAVEAELAPVDGFERTLGAALHGRSAYPRQSRPR